MQIKRAEGSNPHQIGIFGTIGLDVTRHQVEDALNKLEGDIDVHINSTGGSLFEGIDIYNKLRAYNKGRITGYIDGLCASSATLVACGCDSVTMLPTSLYMVHQASAGIYGTANELDSIAELLRSSNGIISNIYAKKTGKSVDQFSDLLNKRVDVFLNAEDSKALGLVNEVDDFNVMTGDKEPWNNYQASMKDPNGLLHSLINNQIRNFSNIDIKGIKEMNENKEQEQQLEATDEDQQPQEVTVSPEVEINNTLQVPKEEAQPKPESQPIATAVLNKTDSHSNKSMEEMSNKLKDMEKELSDLRALNYQNKPLNIPKTGGISNMEKNHEKDKQLAQALAIKFNLIQNDGNENPYLNIKGDAIDTFTQGLGIKNFDGNTIYEKFCNAMTTDSFRSYYEQATQLVIKNITTPLFTDISQFVQFKTVPDYKGVKLDFEIGRLVSSQVLETGEVPMSQLTYKTIEIKPVKYGSRVDVSEEFALGSPDLLTIKPKQVIEGVQYGIIKKIVNTIESVPFIENKNHFKTTKIDAVAFDSVNKLVTTIKDDDGEYVYPEAIHILCPKQLELSVRSVIEATSDARVNNDGSPNLHTGYKLNVITGLKDDAIYFVEQGNIASISVNDYIIGDSQTSGNNQIAIKFSVVEDKLRNVLSFVSSAGYDFAVIDNNRIFKLEIIK